MYFPELLLQNQRLNKRHFEGLYPRLQIAAIPDTIHPGTIQRSAVWIGEFWMQSSGLSCEHRGTDFAVTVPRTVSENWLNHNRNFTQAMVRMIYAKFKGKQSTAVKMVGDFAVFLYMSWIFYAEVRNRTLIGGVAGGNEGNIIHWLNHCHGETCDNEALKLD